MAHSPPAADYFAAHPGRHLESARVAETWATAIHARLTAHLDRLPGGSRNPDDSVGIFDTEIRAKATRTVTGDVDDKDNDEDNGMRDDCAAEHLYLRGEVTALVSLTEQLAINAPLSKEVLETVAARTHELVPASRGARILPVVDSHATLGVWRAALVCLRVGDPHCAWWIPASLPWLDSAFRELLRATRRSGGQHPPALDEVLRRPDCVFQWLGVAPMEPLADDSASVPADSLGASQKALWWIHAVALRGDASAGRHVDWSLWLGAALLPATRDMGTSPSPRICVDRLANACKSAIDLAHAGRQDVRAAATGLLLSGIGRTRRGRRRLTRAAFDALIKSPRVPDPEIQASVRVLAADPVARELVARVCGAALRHPDAVAAFFHGLFSCQRERSVPPPTSVPTAYNDSRIDRDLLASEQRRWRAAML